MIGTILTVTLLLVLIGIAIYFSYSDTEDAPAKVVQEMCLTSEPFRGDVDVVVTWVDSSCPEWQKARAEARAGPDCDNRDERFPPPEDGIVDAELRLCLDLVAQHMPFVRRVHLVTQRPQRPSWIAAYPHVHVVHHDQIWPDAQGQPSFSSVAIESCLHRIPGLAEHFVYLNDDFYVTSPVTVRHFFDPDGKPIHVADLRDPVELSKHASEAVFASQWCNVAKALACKRVWVPQHVPIPLTRTLMAKCSENFREPWERTTRSAFRAGDGIRPIGLCINVAGQVWSPDLPTHQCEYVDGGDAHEKLPAILASGFPDCMCICVNNCRTADQVRYVVDAFQCCGIGKIPTFPVVPAAQKRKLLLTYKSRDAVPEKVWSALRKYAAGYDVYFFDDGACEEYIGEHYPPAFLDKYRTIEHGAHRADMFRYCALLREAPALYMDIKTWLIRDLDDFLPPSDHNLTVFSSHTGTVHQGVLQVARPNDVVLRECLAHVMRTTAQTMKKEYHCFCRYMHHIICDRVASTTIGPGSYRNDDGYGWRLFEERCNEDGACDSRPRDRYGLCCSIYDQHNAVMHTRYPDFVKAW